MATTPNWQAASASQPGLAAHINQFLGTHNVLNLYTATQKVAVLTNGATTTGTNNLYLAQSFTTAVGQTAIGYIQAPISTTTTTGANLATTTLSLYANSAGAPTGSALISTVLTAEYAYSSTGNGNNNTLTTYPLPISTLSASTQYWLVLGLTASTGQYTWFRSASASGASTSTNGTTWTGQGYGFKYAIYDQSVVTPLICTWEDSGARWTARTYTTTGLLNNLGEYTSGQSPQGYLQSWRSFTYSNGILTGVA